jgi:hypothetical protein
MHHDVHGAQVHTDVLSQLGDLPPLAWVGSAIVLGDAQPGFGASHSGFGALAIYVLTAALQPGYGTFARLHGPLDVNFGGTLS